MQQQPIKNPCQLNGTEVSKTFAKLILPPFSIRCINNRKAHHREVTVIVASREDASRKAKIKYWNGSLAIVYPPFESPRKFNWIAVKNLEVLIFNFLFSKLPEKQLHELAYALLLSGALIVRYVHLKSSSMRVFRQGENSHDAA